MLDILLINIFDASSHLGHTTSLWNKLDYPGFTNEETPKVTQPVSDRAEIRTQAIWFPKYVLSTAMHRGLLGERYKGLTSIPQPFPFALITIPSNAFLWGSQHYLFIGPALQPQPVHSTRTLQRGRDPDDPAQPCTDAGDSSPPRPIFSKPWKLCFLWAFLFLFAS